MTKKLEVSFGLMFQILPAAKFYAVLRHGSVREEERWTTKCTNHKSQSYIVACLPATTNGI